MDYNEEHYNLVGPRIHILYQQGTAVFITKAHEERMLFLGRLLSQVFKKISLKDGDSRNLEQYGL